MSVISPHRAAEDCQPEAAKLTRICGLDVGGRSEVEESKPTIQIHAVGRMMLRDCTVHVKKLNNVQDAANSRVVHACFLKKLFLRDRCNSVQHFE